MAEKLTPQKIEEIAKNFEKIQEVLTKNGVEFTANYGSLIDIKY